MVVNLKIIYIKHYVKANKEDRHIIKIRQFFNSYIIFIFFFLGVFFSGNQLLVHYVEKTFNASDFQFSLLIGAMYVGSLTMVLVLGEVSERIGKRQGIVIAATCYSIGALFIALSSSIHMSIVSFLLFGIGAGGIEGILFSLIGDYNGPSTHKVMNISQAVFSVGAVTGPILVNYMAKAFAYQYVYGIMWAFMGVLAILFWLSKEVDSFAKKTKKKKKGLVIFKLLKNPAMVVFMVALMLAIGSETAVTYWLINYYELIGAVALGSFGLSLYWMSSIPGRIIGAYAKNQSRHLSFGFILGSIGIVLLLVLPTPLLKFIGIAILGLALAPVYPSISTLGARLFPENSAAAFSLMVFSCGLGGALAQPVIGAVSESSSIETVYVGIAVILILLSVMIMIGSKLSNKKDETEVVHQ